MRGLPPARLFNQPDGRLSPAAGARGQAAKAGAADRIIQLAKTMPTLPHIAPSQTGAETVAVALSGGLDSLVAAALLQRQGYKVIGLTMQIWDEDRSASGRIGCQAAAKAPDLELLQRLSDRLGIPWQVISLVEEYQREVIDYFRRAYLAGYTPNPCVACNWKLKFGLLPEKARAQGIVFDKFATGHYARVGRAASGQGYRLQRGRDAAKDQSYFLFRLTQAQLEQLSLPLGAFTKAEVRRYAQELALDELRLRPESQDFIGPQMHAALFAEQQVPPGAILNSSGQTIGRHRGLVHYTIGQRKGLGLSGRPAPLYVTQMDGQRNTLTVGTYPELFSQRLRASQLNWIGGAAPSGARRITAQIRSRHRAAAATLSPDPQDATAMLVVFDQPQLAITPGQAVVFYEDATVLGGGTIIS